MKSIYWIATYTYVTRKNLVSLLKEEITCNNIIKQYKDD